MNSLIFCLILSLFSQIGWSDQIPSPTLTQISAGSSHTCLLSTEKLKCFGSNLNGQSDVPSDLGEIEQLSAGSFHTCVLARHQVKCWGYADEGALDVPVNLGEVTWLAAGGFHNCVIADHQVKCWGPNYYHQLEIPKMKNPRLLAAGVFHTCALDDDQVKCWGYNGFGQTDVPQVAFTPAYWPMPISIAGEPIIMGSWGIGIQSLSLVRLDTIFR